MSALRSLACSALTAFAMIATASAQAPKVAAIGDSLTDEYFEQTYSYAKGWTQILVETGRIDMGPTAATVGVGDWGEPRRTGYRNNWARYAANTEGATRWEFQQWGVAGAVTAGHADYVVIFIGGNDFAPWYNSVYTNIYSNTWSQAEITAFIESRIANYRLMFDALRSTGARIVLASPPDFSIMPWVWGAHRILDWRQRVNTAVAQHRDALRRLAREERCVFIDMFRLNDLLFAPTEGLRQEMLLGNVPVALPTWGISPDRGFVEDGAHPHSAVQAVWAGAFVTALNDGFNTRIPVFTEQDMTAAAGLAYGNADTLGLLFPPFGEYVENFACPGDYNHDHTVSVQDIFSFLSAYFTGEFRADVDASGGVSVEDIFAFLAEYFIPCQ